MNILKCAPGINWKVLKKKKNFIKETIYNYYITVYN